MQPTLRQSVVGLPMSPTLGANQKAASKRHRGETIYHMGFGQSPFPTHRLLKRQLADAASTNHYELVAGAQSLRANALDYLSRNMGVNADDFDIFVAPGSKLILYALQLAIEGDVLIPVPSWVSYSPQADLLGDATIHFDAHLSDEGYVVGPEALRQAVVRARENGLNPTKLILNSPNNPTGLAIPNSTHKALASVCQEFGLFVICDEIYRLVSFEDPGPSFAATLPGQTAVSTGLSKHLSLGGWRLGVGLVPKAARGLFRSLNVIASETWSSVATPIQEAAAFAYIGDTDLERHIRTATSIHRAVATEAARILRRSGITCSLPQGAFYLWPDFDSFRTQLERKGITDSLKLADFLLDNQNVLALPGLGFGAPKDRLALRLSVCDYDGADALAQALGTDPAVTDVASIAPNVVAGATAITECVRSLAQ